MSTPLWPLEQALAGRLAGQIIITKGGQPFTVPIPDEVDEGTPMPYIIPAEETENDAQTIGEDAYEITWTCEAWSRSSGRREVKAILDKVEELLNSGPLDLGAGWHCYVPGKPELCEVYRGPKRGIRVGVQRFRFLIERR